MLLKVRSLLLGHLAHLRFTLYQNQLRIVLTRPRQFRVYLQELVLRNSVAWSELGGSGQHLNFVALVLRRPWGFLLLI